MTNALEVKGLRKSYGEKELTCMYAGEIFLRC